MTWPSVIARATLVIALAACRRAPVPDDTLVVLVESPLARLDPRFALGSWEGRVSWLVAPGLVAPDESAGVPVTALAETVTSDDAQIWTVRLRPDARFSDGRAVEAEDVRATFASIMDPATGSPYRQSYAEVVARIDVMDARSLRFVLHRPHAGFRAELHMGILARGSLGTAAADAESLIGAGPYRLAARATDTVTLERNPFATTRARSPRLQVRSIRDDNARLLALVGGSADVIVNGVTPLVIEALEHDPRVAVTFARSHTLTYVGCNLDDALLRDRRVRQAIALALDRERLVSARFGGHAIAARSLLAESNPFFAREATLWPHDPAHARQLLDDAGLRDPDRDGSAPRATLVWKVSSNRFRTTLVQAMARQLAEVGLVIEVRLFEFATFLDDVRKGDFQLFLLQTADVTEPDMLRSFFHSARIPTAANDWGGHNRFRFRDAALDDALDRAAATADTTRRRAVYGDVQLRVSQDLPFIPLWHEDNVMVTRRVVRDARVLPTGRLEGLLGAYKTSP